MKSVTSRFIKMAHRSMVGALVFVILVSCLGCVGNTAKLPSPYTPEELGEFPVHPELEYKKGYRYSPPELAGTDFKPTWTGHYYGPRPPESYVAFYLREMKARDWQIRKITEKSEGDKVLDFVKETDGATIELQRKFDRKTSKFGCYVIAEIRTLGLQHFSPEENYRHLTGKPNTAADPVPPASDNIEEKPSIQPVKGTLKPANLDKARQELIIE